MKPRVGISRCLLGDDVRYDGTHRKSDAVMALAEWVDWEPVCPEVEVGMGIPREPIQLVAEAGGVRTDGEPVGLLGVHSKEDWTNRMTRWSQRRVQELSVIGISGFVLKARSPSCGPANVLVHRPDSEPAPTGRGLFAEALTRAIPGLPMEDEETLASPQARDVFLERVRQFLRARSPG